MITYCELCDDDVKKPCQKEQGVWVCSDCQIDYPVENKKRVKPYIKVKDKDRQKTLNAKSREKRKRGEVFRDYSNDGSSINREMATAKLVLHMKKRRAEKENPFTSHPLTFEEIDAIPDIKDSPVGAGFIQKDLKEKE